MIQSRRIAWIVSLFMVWACCGTAAADSAASGNSATSSAAPAPAETSGSQPSQPSSTAHITPQQVAQTLLKMTQDGDYTAFIKQLAPSCQPDERLVRTRSACEYYGKKCPDHIPREEWSFLERGHVVKKNNVTKLVVRRVSEFDSCKLPANLLRLAGDPRTNNGVYTIKPTHYVWVELTDPMFGTKQFLPLAIVRIENNGWQIVGGSCVVQRPLLSLLKKYCDSAGRR